MTEQLTLHGCSPTPLASYLKALGVLRLLSSGLNSVTGEPADPGVRGWWVGERFHLRTTLGREGVLDFLLNDYAPTPVIAPWNGGSGFYPGYYSQAGINPLRAPVVSKRFRPFAETVRVAIEVLRHFDLPIPIPDGETEKAKKKRRAAQRERLSAAKPEIVGSLRARLPESALPWLDAVLVLSGEDLKFPPLLGTGANDGNLEFTNNLMHRLFSEAKPPGIFKVSSGRPSPSGARLLDHALFTTSAHDLMGVAVGQFSPGEAGGPNSTTGYEGEPIVNPWDYVFMLEGATTFACAATRRYQSNSLARASFPFTVAASGAGWGGIEAVDESEARAEFWAPLWSRPATFFEVKALFGEGRAVTNAQTAGDGLDFARALAALGVSRGFSEFQRYGFFKRSGKNHYAAAIGRRRAEPSPGAELIADLDSGGWLRKARRFGRDSNQPAAVRKAVKAMEDSLFDLLAPDCSSSATRTVLEFIGRLGDWLSNSPKGREKVPPPPLLSRSWLRRADDESPEFRIATALAGLGIPPPAPGKPSDSNDANPGDFHAPPMAAHLAPLTNGSGEGFERATFFRRRWLRKRRAWAHSNRPPTVVWGHGDLVGNMIAVLERRLVETPVRGLADKPFGSASFARLSDVMAFLTGDFDDARCSALLSGMVWAQPAWLPSSDPGPTTARTGVPFAYAVLKPIFSTNEVLRRLGAIPSEVSIPIPPGLARQMRAGGRSRDGRVIDQAVRAAFSRTRSSGLPSPYDPIQSGGRVSGLHSGRIGVGVRPDRLTAATLIPISDRGLASLLRRAYPGSIPETAIYPSEETPNVD